MDEASGIDMYPTSKQGRENVVATSRRYVEINATLPKRHVSAIVPVTVFTRERGTLLSESCTNISCEMDGNRFKPENRSAFCNSHFFFSCLIMPTHVFLRKPIFWWQMEQWWLDISFSKPQYRIWNYIFFFFFHIKMKANIIILHLNRKFDDNNYKGIENFRRALLPIFIRPLSQRPTLVRVSEAENPCIVVTYRYSNSPLRNNIVLITKLV